MRDDTLIYVEKLTYNHPHRRILQNLDFHVNQGECLVLTGANGTGKSTTLNILAGLIRPTRGRVFIHKMNIHDCPQLAKKHLGFLPDKAPLYHELTVKEYLKWVAELRLISKQEHHILIENALSQLSLIHHQDHLIGTLSKGQQQRVGIAQAILHKPKVLLLDEPTQGLDPKQIDSFLHFLNAYKKQSAVVLSSHHFPEVEFLCDKRLAFTEEGVYEYDLSDCSA